MDIPAAFLLLYWFAIQFFSGVGSVGYSQASSGDVAWFAHVGGFLAGMVLIILMPGKPRGCAPTTENVSRSEFAGSAGIEKPLDILAIAAHPDDVEQTCGGTLIRMAEAGYRTGVLDLTAGDMGSRGTPEIRLEGGRCGRAARMSLAWRGNLRLPDARLENTVSARMTLAAEIRNLRPRVVILPYWEARHPDHYRACGDRIRSLLPGRPEEAGRRNPAAPARRRFSIRRSTPT